MTDQYSVDYDGIIDMLSELGDTPFPAVGAGVLNTSRPAADPAGKAFTAPTSSNRAPLSELSPTSSNRAPLSDGAYQKTASNRWRWLQPGRALYLTTLDLVAVLLRSDPRGLVIVPTAATDSD